MEPQTARPLNGTNGRAEPLRALIHELQAGKRAISPEAVMGHIKGDSPGITELKKDIEIAAQMDFPVLVLGESGTGKELVAMALHLLSLRSTHAFITVNCAAIPEGLAESALFGHVKGAFTGAIGEREGKFHAADTGTIFLDEIGELPLSLQAKILRTLQTGEVEKVGSNKTQLVDVRIIAATNRDIDGALFRSDLLHRLSGYRINVPPLRERNGDIPLLARHFLDEFNGRYGKKIGISDDALSALKSFQFPGNIRQLSNVIECAAAFSAHSGTETVSAREIGSALKKLSGMQFQRSTDLTGIETLEAFIGRLPELPDEQAINTRVMPLLMLEALKRSGGNKSKAAKLLGINRTTLVERLGRLSRGLGISRIDEDTVQANIILGGFKEKCGRIQENEAGANTNGDNETANGPASLQGRTPESISCSLSHESLEAAIRAENPFVRGGLKLVLAKVAKTLGISSKELYERIGSSGIDARTIFNSNVLTRFTSALETSGTVEEARQKIGYRNTTHVYAKAGDLGIRVRDFLGRKMAGADS